MTIFAAHGLTLGEAHWMEDERIEMEWMTSRQIEEHDSQGQADRRQDADRLSDLEEVRRKSFSWRRWSSHQLERAGPGGSPCSLSGRVSSANGTAWADSRTADRSRSRRRLAERQVVRPRRRPRRCPPCGPCCASATTQTNSARPVLLALHLVEQLGVVVGIARALTGIARGVHARRALQRCPLPGRNRPRTQSRPCEGVVHGLLDRILLERGAVSTHSGSEAIFGTG